MENIAEYKFYNFNKQEVFELNKENSEIIFEENTIPSGTLGDLPSYVVMVTVPLLSIIAAYLLKKYKGESFTEEFEELKPDGSYKKRKITYKKKSTEAPKVEILNEILKQIKGE